MSDERLNELVEERVFGRAVRFDGHDYVPDTQFGAVAICRNCEDMYFDWEEPTEECKLYVPYYATSPSDDYLVLKHVRENWTHPTNDKYHAFIDALCEIWYEAAGDLGLRWDEYAAFYEPGDYSRAALAALGVEVQA